MSSSNLTDDLGVQDDEGSMLDEAEAEEEISTDADHPMESDSEGEDNDEDDIHAEIELQNDSLAHFDYHTDSIFCITSHPHDSTIIATGSGDDTAYIFSSTLPSPVFPASYESNPQPAGSRESLQPIAQLKGHTDSINAIAFSLPDGRFLCTAGLDGRLNVYTTPSPLTSPSHTLLDSAQEVPEINWLSPTPHPSHPNSLALGASDGSVWLYTIDPTTKPALLVQQAYYQHTASCTAGAWSPDGKLLATVSEDGSFYVYDPFGEAAAAGITVQGASQAVVNLTASDQRFAVEGGLFSVAIAPSGAFAAVGGAGGNIRIVGLPILPDTSIGATAKTKPAKNRSGGKQPSTVATSIGQTGQILASLQAQTDGIETLAFSAPPLTLLAAGSVDGSVALYDTAHRFAVRRLIREAHEEYAVVKVEFAPAASTRGSAVGASSGAAAAGSWLLTTCGMDGVVRQWDTRGGTAASGLGLVGEWRGHRGEGEGGGVMGFSWRGTKVVTAGDDGVVLVFDTAAN